MTSLMTNSQPVYNLPAFHFKMDHGHPLQFSNSHTSLFEDLGHPVDFKRSTPEQWPPGDLKPGQEER